MGERVDDMLDGWTCEACGDELIDWDDPDWEPCGYVEYCDAECAATRLPHTAYWFADRNLPVPATPVPT